MRFIFLIELLAGVLFAPLLQANTNINSPEIDAHNVEAGEVYHGAIELVNKSDHSKLINIQLADIAVSPNGETIFYDPGTMARSNSSWISLNRKKIIIASGQTEIVKYSVGVPSGNALKGEYRSSLIFTEINTDWNALGAGNKNKHVIQLISRIDQPEDGKLHILETSVIQSLSDTHIFVKIENTGYGHLSTALWAEVYDMGGAFIGRFQAEEKFLYANQQTSVTIPLKGLSIGKYRAILAGKNAIATKFKNIQSVSLSVAHMTPFTLAMNRNKQRIVSNGAVVNEIMASREEGEFLVRVARNYTVGSQDYQKGRLFASAKRSPNYLEKSPSINHKEAKPTSTKSLAKRYHTVKSGDWLSKLALTYYGDMGLISEIIAANKDIIKSPHLIYPGQKLKIPHLEPNTNEKVTLGRSRKILPTKHAEEEKSKLGKSRGKVYGRKTAAAAPILYGSYFFSLGLALRQ